MKAFSLFFFFILVTNYALGDEFEDSEKVKSQILSFVEVLKKEGVDTIFTYQSNAIGYDRVIDVPAGASENEVDSLFCESKEPGYVFWVSKNKGYCKKFHPCVEFDTAAFSALALLTFLNSTPGLLAGAPLKPFQMKQKGEIHSVIVDHSERTKVWFKIGRLEKCTVIDSFSLLKSQFGAPVPNLNYASNRKKPFFLLSRLLGSIIEKTVFPRVRMVKS